MEASFDFSTDTDASSPERPLKIASLIMTHASLDEPYIGAFDTVAIHTSPDPAFVTLMHVYNY